MAEQRKKKLVATVGCVVLLLAALAVVSVIITQNFLLSPRPRKGSEARATLRTIRAIEMVYFAEEETYVGNQPPTPVLDRRGNSMKVRWDPETRFSILGFTPLNKFYCSYSLEGPDWPTEAQGFTVRAECDEDGDGNMAVYTINHHSSEVRQTGDER